MTSAHTRPERDPDIECQHDNYEIDVCTGLAECDSCLKSWYLSAAEIYADTEDQRFEAKLANHEYAKGAARSWRRSAIRFQTALAELKESAAIPREQENKMSQFADDQIKYMVNRFLGWKLPENFSPDAGISFKATFNEHTAHPMKREPSGTNLFDATQADAMVRYMVEGIPREQEAKPVAWQWHSSEGWITIIPETFASAQTLKDSGYEIRSLYAAPPSDSPGSAHQPQGGDAQPKTERVGKYEADYSLLSAEEIAKEDPNLTELYAHSKPAPVRAAAEPGEMRKMDSAPRNIEFMGRDSEGRVFNCRWQNDDCGGDWYDVHGDQLGYPVCWMPLPALSPASANKGRVMDPRQYPSDGYPEDDSASANEGSAA
jgi:hypothetical protein